MCEAIMLANPAYNGFSTPEEVLKIFKVMINYANSPADTPSQPSTTFSTVYSPYMSMPVNGQYGMLNNGGQTWNYGGYIGYNPYGFRQS